MNTPFIRLESQLSEEPLVLASVVSVRCEKLGKEGFTARSAQSKWHGPVLEGLLEGLTNSNALVLVGADAGDAEALVNLESVARCKPSTRVLCDVEGGAKVRTEWASRGCSSECAGKA